MTSRSSEEVPPSVAAVLVHEAAHAVVAWELGIRLGQVYVSSSARAGRMTFASDISLGRYVPGTEACRRAAERDMLVLHAGFMAQQRFHYEGTHSYPLHDYVEVFRICVQLEDDFALIDAWSEYVEDRARAMIERPPTWARIQALAVELARRSRADGTTLIDGEAVEAFLRTVPVPPSDGHLAYRRREAKGIVLLLEDEVVRRPLEGAVARAYRVAKAGRRQ